MIPIFIVAAGLLGHRPELAELTRLARTYDKASFRFRPPSDEQMRHTRALVASLLRRQGVGGPPAALVEEARAAGFVLEESRDAGGPVWVLHEPEGLRAGRGLFAFRAGASKLCIQAPHSFYDEGTGDIGLALFARLSARCFFVNTVHRYSPGDGGGDHPADVAHAPLTLFHAASQGLLDVAPFTLVQVHGFGDGQGLPADVRAVVSDGGRRRPADAPAVRLRSALARRLGAGSVRLFGDDADVLGATTNVEGQDARKAGAVFLHIEMSAPTRRALVKEAAPLAEALRETLAGGDPHAQRR